MIFEAVIPNHAIGKVAISGIRAALDAGFKVSVVAKYLDEALRDQVEWLPLTVPRRLYVAQWLTARHYMEQALGGRTFDVVHAHQPQAASLSDVFQCHFITRVALERDCLKNGEGLRASFNEIQHKVALYAEDYYYRHWNPQTRMLYDSDMTRRDFHRVYGPLPHEDVLVYAFPALRFPSEQEKQDARRQFIGRDHAGPVIGYLGGLSERKGYRKLLLALEGDTNLFLLLGGPHTESFDAPDLAGKFRVIGGVRDVAAFYAACDAVIVPSNYEPLGLVALEAAACGVPVIATGEVGALPHLLEYGAGAAWHPRDPLEPVVRRVMADCEAMQSGARRMSQELGQENYGKNLLSVYEKVLHQKL